jgi:hypothetical protein
MYMLEGFDSDRLEREPVFVPEKLPKGTRLFCEIKSADRSRTHRQRLIIGQGGNGKCDTGEKLEAGGFVRQPLFWPIKTSTK